MRGGMAELRIETDRWCGISRDERIYKMCDEGEVEDVEHFLLTVMVWYGREEKGDCEGDE